jgi:uncharacterized membrane protein YedE/YeeE
MVFSLHDALMGLVGGLLIGLAGAVLLLGSGRIAGVSGILAALLPPRGQGTDAENAAFVLGIVAAPAAWATMAGAPAIGVTTSIPLLALGGLLVGYGTRLGSGCTSGHGVCGLSRLSLRSMAATGVFMVVAAGVSFAVRQALGA